jgi:hypothetical protein
MLCLNPTMKLAFHKSYFIILVSLFLLEFCIAVFVRDQFVRPFVGDVLVIWLVYAFVRTFYKGPPTLIAWAVFVFACLVELGQYFELASILHLQDSKIARIIIGSTFDWRDLLAYFIGTITLIVSEEWMKRRQKPSSN